MGLTQICPHSHKGCKECEAALQHWDIMFPVQEWVVVHIMWGQAHPLHYVETADKINSNEPPQDRWVYIQYSEQECQQNPATTA